MGKTVQPRRTANTGFLWKDSRDRRRWLRKPLAWKLRRPAMTRSLRLTRSSYASAAKLPMMAPFEQTNAIADRKWLFRLASWRRAERGLNAIGRPPLAEESPRLDRTSTETGDFRKVHEATSAGIQTYRVLPSNVYAKLDHLDERRFANGMVYLRTVSCLERRADASLHPNFANSTSDRNHNNRITPNSHSVPITTDRPPTPLGGTTFMCAVDAPLDAS
jgi:hypothetical protein